MYLLIFLKVISHHLKGSCFSVKQNLSFYSKGCRLYLSKWLEGLGTPIEYHQYYFIGRSQFSLELIVVLYACGSTGFCSMD